MKIKVCLDISQSAHAGGVGTYTTHLAEELMSSDEIELIPLYYSLRKPYKGSLRGVKTIKLPPSLAELAFNVLRQPSLETLVGPIDVFHSSDWTQPKTKAKKITTYHDVIPLKYPQWSDPKIVSVHKRRLKIVEKEIDRVIAVSETTKKDLLECTSIPEEKITVIYEAAGRNFKVHSNEDVKAFRSKYKLPEHFLLAIGGVGDRRNLKNIKEAASEHSVLVTGQDLPYFAPEEMPLLYNSADALVYASLYEGFGLPILEAMQSGTPVVTSDRSSMKEIAGEAAALVDPEDVNSIRQGIERVLKNSSLYKEKGLKRAEMFSWKKCAQETVKVYKSLYEGK